MRKKFLGEAFWIKKMHMFNEARENILKEAGGSAPKAVRTITQDPCLTDMRSMYTHRNSYFVLVSKMFGLANKLNCFLVADGWVSRTGYIHVVAKNSARNTNLLSI